jgi:hypothetical protein
MAAYNTRSGTTALASALRASPEPMDPERHGYAAAGTEAMQGHRSGGPVSPSAIRRASAPIHHHIAPALGAPFMRAEGLVHRGMLPSYTGD